MSCGTNKCMIFPELKQSLWYFENKKIFTEIMRKYYMKIKFWQAALLNILNVIFHCLSMKDNGGKNKNQM